MAILIVAVALLAALFLVASAMTAPPGVSFALGYGLASQVRGGLRIPAMLACGLAGPALLAGVILFGLPADPHLPARTNSSARTFMLGVAVIQTPICIATAFVGATARRRRKQAAMTHAHK